MTQRYFLWKDNPRDVVIANIERFIPLLPESKSWKIEISEYHKERSNLQNNALWGVAYPAICRATGYNPNDLHEAMCGKFFGWVDIPMLGEVKRKPFRTTTRDELGRCDVIGRDAFSDFYCAVQQEAAQVGIDVPNPIPKIVDGGWQSVIEEED